MSQPKINHTALPPIAPKDLDRLRAFQRQTEWLRKSKLMNSKGVKLSFNVKFSFDTKMTTRTFTGYDNEQFLAILPVLRQFVMNDEPVQLFGIHNILMKHCEREDIREWVKYSRMEWSDALTSLPSSNLMFFSPAGSTDEAIQEMFYGFGGLFHVDLSKPKIDEQLAVVMMATLQKAFPRLWNAIRNIDSSIHNWLDDPKAIIPRLKILEQGQEDSNE